MFSYFVTRKNGYHIVLILRRIQTNVCVSRTPILLIFIRITSTFDRCHLSCCGTCNICIWIKGYYEYIYKIGNNLINTLKPKKNVRHFADDIFTFVPSLVQIIAWLRVGDKPWASYQIRTIAGCACAGNAGNVFPRRRIQRKTLVSDPVMHHGTCVTHVPWCMSGSLTRCGRENVPGILGACAPVILRIWQEAHYVNQCWPILLMHIYASLVLNEIIERNFEKPPTWDNWQIRDINSERLKGLVDYKQPAIFATTKNTKRQSVFEFFENAIAELRKSYV